MVVTGAAGYIGSVVTERLVERATTWSRSTTWPTGTATRCTRGRRLRRRWTCSTAHGSSGPRAAREPPRCRRAPGRRGADRRVDPRPRALLPRQHDRRPQPARRDGRRPACSPARLLLHRRRLRRAGGDPDSEKMRRASRSTPTASRSWRSSGRCRGIAAPTASATSRCATSTPAAPPRARRAARAGNPPHPDPAGRGARASGRRSTCSAPTTTRPTAPASGTTCTCRTSPTRTCCASSTSTRCEPTAFNLGNGTGYSNRQVIAAVERVTGRPLSRGRRAAPARAIRRAGGQRRAHPATARAGAPRIPDLDIHDRQRLGLAGRPTAGLREA